MTNRDDLVALLRGHDPEIERLRADNEMLRGLIDLPPGHHHVHVNKDGTITAVPMQLLTGPLRPRPTITPLWVDAPVLPVETP